MALKDLKGNRYPTISDATQPLNASVKTIRQWIEKGIIPKPPEIEYGSRKVLTFPDTYIASAREALKEYRKNRPKPKKKKKRPAVKRK